MTTNTKYAKRNKKANFTTADPIRDGWQTLYIRVQCLPFSFAFAKLNKRRTTAIRGGYCNNDPVNWVDVWGLNAGVGGDNGVYETDVQKNIGKEEAGQRISGSIFLNLNIDEQKNFSITYNEGGYDPNGYTEILTPKFNWLINPHGKTNLAKADIFYKHRNGISPGEVVVIFGIKIQNIRNFYDRNGRYINSEINYEEIFSLPGGTSLK